MDVHAIATFLSEHYFTVKDDDNILNTCIVSMVMLNCKLLYYVTIGWRIMKSCFFIGHWEADERLLPVLQRTIRRLIEEEDVTEFYVGGYGGFDRIAGAAVKQLKAEYEEDLVRRMLYLQHCREALERCIAGSRVTVRYRRPDGSQGRTSFRKEGPNRVRVTGLVAD